MSPVAFRECSFSVLDRISRQQLIDGAARVNLRGHYNRAQQ